MTTSEILDDFAPELARALKYTGGTHTLEDLKEAAESGEIQVWPGVRSVMLTKIVDRPQKKELVFFLGAGHMAEVERLYQLGLVWGKGRGRRNQGLPLSGDPGNAQSQVRIGILG